MMRPIFISLTIILAASLALSACSSPQVTAVPAQSTPQVELPKGPIEGKVVEVAGGSFRQITPLELAAMLQNKDFTLINVHVPYVGHIANTDQFIQYDQIEQNLSQLPSDKNARIVVYCSSGHMSGEAAQTLVGLGYTNVWDLAGGMSAWQKAGFSLEQQQK